MGLYAACIVALSGTLAAAIEFDACNSGDVACASEESSLLQHTHIGSPSGQATLLGSIATQLNLSLELFTVSGTHFARGYHDEAATEVNPYGMFDDCYNINLNKKLTTGFLSSRIEGLTGFFYKCESFPGNNTNKYWFTISATTKASAEMLCSSAGDFPMTYDRQHNTWFKDYPFTCDGPPAAGGRGLFLQSVATNIGLPQSHLYTVSGTHFAQGYRDESGTEIFLGSAQLGMYADCFNINQNRKLSLGFRGDVFGSDSLFGFFYKCENIPENNTNKYWFTISATSERLADRLCDADTAYPTVYDPQHSTWWTDYPFVCESSQRS